MIHFPREETYGDKINKLYAFEKEDRYKYKDSAARTITFQLTEDCNLCCSYCYQINKAKHKMDFETAKKAVDVILNVDKNVDINNYIDSKNTLGCILEFIGGEPFLEVDLMDQITDYFIETLIKNQHPWLTKYKISISTNGTLYFNEKVQKYIQKNLNHLSLSFSVDGNEQLHDSCRKFPDGSGSYNLAITAAKHYQQHYKQYIGSKLTISPENIEYLDDAMISLFQNDYIYINANCIYEDVWNYDYAKILYQKLRNVADYLINNDLELIKGTSILSLEPNKQKRTDEKNWCGGNGKMLAVNYSGNFYPCIRYMESSLGKDIEPYVIGNVYDGIGKTEKEKEKLKNLDITVSSQSTQECLDCPISNGCGWCTAYNYQLYGTVNKRCTSICPMHKARVLANYYYQNKVYKKHNEPTRFSFDLDYTEALKIIDQNELDYLLELSKND